MIQVILLILKIIGITLLAVLGLILLILALVLFVPVFYKVRIIHNPEKTQVKARASFLFPLLLVTFEYLKKISYKVRIFGFALLDSDKPKKEKKPKKKKKLKQKKKPKKSKQKKKTVTEPKAELPALPEAEPLSGPEPVTEQEEENMVLEEAPVFTEAEQKAEQTEKQGFFKKIRCKIQNFRETISNIVNKIKKLLHQKDEVQRILAKPETKQALKFVWEELKHLLKHILPRKIKGYVAYGADNPATTGQVLGILSVVYAKTGQLLEVRPNFEEKQLECDVELKGRVQVFTLLVIAIKVFLNQELRQLVTEFKNVKEIE